MAVYSKCQSVKEYTNSDDCQYIYICKSGLAKESSLHFVCLLSISLMRYE